MKTTRSIPYIFILWFIAFFYQGSTVYSRQPSPKHNLWFSHVPVRWDEGLPLGNGVLGNLIWQKGDALRFSLDRVDLWDERPMKALDRPEFSYEWVRQQVLANDYAVVQRYFDDPYEQEAAPSKIPGAALMFKVNSDPARSELNIAQAQPTIHYKDGLLIQSFVHASQPVGWFEIENAPNGFKPTIDPPPYQGSTIADGDNAHSGDDLIRLGYPKGSVSSGENYSYYTQAGWEDFSYDVYVEWYRYGSSLIGAWSISQNKQEKSAKEQVKLALERGYQVDRQSHLQWWESFWKKSAIRLPDEALEKQWYLEQYKFGCVARKEGPAISLQAIWTADNGRIPPWKGDFHHDLNTQLSYWPAYSANHMEEAEGFLNFLESCKPAFGKFTKDFFNAKGLAVPGVTALDGSPLGGWIQYSCSPTTAAWLSQHYYLQWRYSMDRSLLEARVYPWFKGVITFFEEILIEDNKGKLQLPLSSSPEINDNRINAWFLEMTNYDLALIRFTFQHGIELALELGQEAQAKRWKKMLGKLPDFALSTNKELLFAPALPYEQSHRHFSHLMALHPLGLIRWEEGKEAQDIIKKSISLLEQVGPDYWTGYSWAWLANLKARAKDGDGTAAALAIFAKAFCSPNTFHLNGDQTKSGYSKYTYRPFTLEGNFAFAAGIQEMLIQSYTGIIELFPAIPADWQDVEFEDLRADGAFLVSAKRKGGKLVSLQIKADKGGLLRLFNPFDGVAYRLKDGRMTPLNASTGIIEMKTEPGELIILQSQ